MTHHSDCQHRGSTPSETHTANGITSAIYACRLRTSCTITDAGLRLLDGQPFPACETCEQYAPPPPPLAPVVRPVVRPAPTCAVTIGMATYDDYFGIWATLQALHNARVEAGLVDQVEFVVVDNNPRGTHGPSTKGQVAAYTNSHYVEFADHQGTSGPRNKVFDAAKGRGVVVIDPHVMFARPVETLRKLVDFWSREQIPPRHNGRALNRDLDLMHGPCMHDCLVDHTGKPYMVGTHWRDEWGSDGMLGKWATAEPFASEPSRINAPDALPFEVPLNACGLFMASRDSWLGFHSEQRGFGAEEGTIHHKYRKHGRTTYVLPWLQWVHRWGKIGGVPYGGMEWKTRCRNYLLSTRDYGWPTVAELRSVFVMREPRHIPPNGDPNLATTGQQRVTEPEWNDLLNEMGLSGTGAAPVVTTHTLTLLDPDPGLQSWESEYLANPAFECVSREHRVGSVLCNIGCPNMQSQPVSLHWCKAHQSAVTLGKRRNDAQHCMECPLRKPLDDEANDPLVAHVAWSIQQADQLKSRLPESTFAVQGMTSPRVRHLLTNLCSAPGTKYLEVGCWLGALHVSAQAGNEVESAVAVDDFSQFNQYGSARETFIANCRTHLGHDPRLIDGDFRPINFEELSMVRNGPFNVYLYDAAHDPQSQHDGIVCAWPALASRFILLVDDANLPGVLDATREALKQCGAKIDRHWLLPAKFNGDVDRWWNGLAVAVITKPSPKD